MVHDLTANRDFQKDRSWLRLNTLLMPRDKEDELTPPYEEVVLTGTTFERNTKRYVLDYESDTNNMCDCCGAPIRIRLWDFDEIKTLCPECEKWLEETQNNKNNGELFQEVIDDSMTVRCVKPWDIHDSNNEENAIDNVLLWD